VEDHWTVAGIAGFPGGFGFETRYRFTPGVAASMQVSTSVIFTEFGLRAHWYAVRGDHVSFVVSGGAHGLAFLMSLNYPLLEVEATGGVEWRGTSRFTLGVDLGPSLLLFGEDNGGPLPFAFALGRVGWSW
jgi:hypothetical protein